MEDVIREKLAKIDSIAAKRNYLREYLQALILKVLFEKKHFQKIIFTGGTALRFVHDLKRFSEDLDFSSYDPTFDFGLLIKDLEYELKKYNLFARIKNNDTNIVKNAFIKFESLLYDLGLSAQKEEVISIKLEIDSNPPLGGKTETSLINRHFMFYTQVFDLPSLMAGKIHALCFRKYLKGRDFYDLGWYLGQKIQPNFELLINAIEQTENKKIEQLQQEWKKLLIKRLESADMNKLRVDILPFLENPQEIELIDKELMIVLLSK